MQPYPEGPDLHDRLRGVWAAANGGKPKRLFCLTCEHWLRKRSRDGTARHKNSKNLLSMSFPLASPLKRSFALQFRNAVSDIGSTRRAIIVAAFDQRTCPKPCLYFAGKNLSTRNLECIAR